MACGGQEPQVDTQAIRDGVMRSGWFRPPAISQADGDDGQSEKATRMEPYPQLNSIQQDEAIYWLKGVVGRLEKRIDVLEKK